MNGYDEASSHQPRHLMPLESYQARGVVLDHAATARLRLGGSLASDTGLAPDKEFHSSNEVWESILLERIKPPMRMTLESFFLFEWFPRVPGLYFTEEGREARREAQHRIESIENGVVVYNPYGKMSMLDGGVGNVRLRPVLLHEPECYLMSASSNGACHQGFPVAVPSPLYERVIAEILERGCKVLRLSGRLCFLPKDRTLQHRYHGVPELYLAVDEITDPRHPRSRSMEDLNVSVAVSFISRYEGEPRVYASYVNFLPGDERSFRENLEWLEESYVEESYQGQIITDFDEQRGRFPDAVFGLQKVMRLGLELNEVTEVARFLDIDPESIMRQQTELQLSIVEVYMAPKYQITGGQQGSVGDNARATNFTQLWQGLSQDLDLQKLAEELDRLRARAKESATTPEHDAAVGSLAEAQVAAQNGDGPNVLKHLARAGEWALEVATKIGVSVAASAIKNSMGF